MSFGRHWRDRRDVVSSYHVLKRTFSISNVRCLCTLGAHSTFGVISADCRLSSDSTLAWMCVKPGMGAEKCTQPWQAQRLLAILLLSVHGGFGAGLPSKSAAIWSGWFQLNHHLFLGKWTYFREPSLEEFGWL